MSRDKKKKEKKEKKKEKRKITSVDVISCYQEVKK